MAGTQEQSRPSGVNHFVQGSISGTYTAANETLTLGFVPRYFKVTDITTRISGEWYNGMNSGDYLKTVAAGTRTLETDDKIVVNTDGTVSLVASGGIHASNSTVCWEARA